MKRGVGELAILALVLALILVVVANTSAPLLAATSGPLNAGTGADVDGPGTVAWTNAGNILADDINYATATIGATATSEYLQGTAYGFSIPLVCDHQRRPRCWPAPRIRLLPGIGYRKR